MKSTIVATALSVLLFQPVVHALEIPPEPSCGANTKVHDVCSTAILNLHPTQFSAGMIEIQDRTEKIENMRQHKFTKFMKKHLVPVVIGPHRVFYMTDHHHLSLALYDAGLRTVNVQVTNDWSNLSTDQFWSQMESAHQVYLYEDGNGPLPPSKLPANVLQLHDDIYRSLAWAVQDQTGAFQKTSILFESFIWANFFRQHIPLSYVQSNFEGAVQQAAQLAQSPAAKGLPGYIGSETQQCTYFSPCHQG